MPRKERSDSANQLRMVEVGALRDVAVAALSNPLVVMVGGIVVGSMLEKTDIIDHKWGDVIRGGAVGVATVQALAPVVKSGGLTGALLALGAGGLAGGAATGGLGKLFTSGLIGDKLGLDMGENIGDLFGLLSHPTSGKSWLKALNPFG